MTLRRTPHIVALGLAIALVAAACGTPEVGVVDEGLSSSSTASAETAETAKTTETSVADPDAETISSAATSTASSSSPLPTVPDFSEQPEGSEGSDAERVVVAAAPLSGDIRDVDFLNGVMLPHHNEFNTSDTAEAQPASFGPLVDGEFFNGEFGESQFWGYFLSAPAYVDFDADGIDEVAVTHGAWNGGGSGWFSELRAFEIDGEAVVEIDVVHYGDRAFGGIVDVTKSGTGQSVLVDVFVDGEGACCAHTVVRENVGWNGDELFVTEEPTPIRYAELTAESRGEVDELTFLPGTSSALVGVVSGEAGLIQFDARSGQRVTVVGNDTVSIAEMQLTHVETGDTVPFTSDVVLASDGLFELSLTTDAGDEPVHSTLLFTIDGSATDNGTAPTAGTEWTLLEWTETVRTEPVEVVATASLPEFPDYPAASETIANFVDTDFQSWVEYAYDAEFRGDNTELGGEYELTPTVTLSSPELIAVEFSYYEYLCCRPYPNYGFQSVVVEADSGRMLSNADIVDMDRWEAVQEVWFEALLESGVLGSDFPVDTVFPTAADGPVWTSLSVTPDGLLFGTNRSGAIPSTSTLVSFDDLGDLVMPDILTAVSA